MSLFFTKTGSSNTTSTVESINRALTTSKESENNRGSQFSLNQYDYIPKRFGLRFDPPTIIIEYLIPSSGKLYHHKMKVLGLKKTSDNDEIIDALREKHSPYFATNKISDEQLSNLIDKLKKRLPQDENEKGSVATNDLQKTGGFSFKPQLSVKAETSKDFKTTDHSAKGFSPALSLNSLGSTISSKFEMSLPDTSNKNNTNANGFWDLEDEEDEVDYQTTNLNKLTPEEVKKHKDKMDVLFKQNQKKPGDPGFIYDKREEFEPTEDNEWDEEL